jgi:hypothetical protein
MARWNIAGLFHGILRLLSLQVESIFCAFPDRLEVFGALSQDFCALVRIADLDRQRTTFCRCVAASVFTNRYLAFHATK